MQNLDVYLFIIDPAIAEYAAGINGGQQMGVTYCSYHASFQYSSSKWLDYAVVQPNSAKICTITTAATVNGVAIDSMLFNMAHEIVETVLAPNAHDRSINAMWQDGQGNEPMDKCGCSLPNQQARSSDGLQYNTYFNGNYFYLPSIWDRINQKCVFNANSAPVTSYPVPSNGNPNPIPVTVPSTNPIPVTVPSNGYCSICTAPGSKAIFSGGSPLTSGRNWSGSSTIIASSTGTMLSQQSDGQICIKTAGLARQVWCSGSWKGTGSYSLAMQNDGNLVSTSATVGVIWASNTGGRAQQKYCAVLRGDNQNDNNDLVIYDQNCGKVWASNAL